MPQIRRLAHIFAWVFAAAASLPAAGDQLSFTRPTLGAVRVDAPPKEDRVLLEDDSFRFVVASQHLLVYGKLQQRWILVEQLTTDHGRFGEAPPTLQVGWQDGYLINSDFTTVPLSLSRPAERIVGMAIDGVYRVDFGVQLHLDSALTSLWISIADLEAALRGQRPPVVVQATHRLSHFWVRTDPTLAAVVRVNSNEALFWSIESGALETVAYPIAATQHSSRRADLSIAGMTLHAIEIGVPAGSRPGIVPAKGAGVIGADLLERYAMVVDYDAGTMQLFPPDGFIAGDAGEPIAADWRSRVPVIRARITLGDGRTIEPRLVVDTGTPEPLVLRPSFAAAHQMVPDTRARAVELGTYTLRDWPLTVAATTSDGVVNADGTIGGGTLRRFHVTFDRQGGRVFVSPGELLGIPYDYDASGLRIVINGRDFGVGDVRRGYTSGAQSRSVNALEGPPGFRVGDIIVEFDGRPLAGATLAAVRSAFKADGRPHAVVVRRHGALRTITYDAPAALR